jgi:hypothetical protein
LEKVLLFIKNHLKSVWVIIDWVNSLLYSILYLKKQSAVLGEVLSETVAGGYNIRVLDECDMPFLHSLIAEQSSDDLAYFQPHGFSLKDLERQYRKSSFLMMGVFHGDILVGYFFLRFFFNKKCFVGRLIDKNYRGRRIGSEMNRIMYETAWRMKFRCLSTISRNNVQVMRAHSRNDTMKILKHLGNNYMLVEFVKKGEK